jgi:hypothetical protein
LSCALIRCFRSPLQAFPLDVQVKLKDAALCTLSQARGQVSVHKVAGRPRPALLPYLAPEVLLGHRPRRSADAFAFGILMWELYTGAWVGHHISFTRPRGAGVLR